MQGLIRKIANVKSKMPMSDKLWDKSDEAQRQAWREMAEEDDKIRDELIQQVREEMDKVFSALKIVYGNGTNYKGRPIDGGSKLYHKIEKYLKNNTNSPYRVKGYYKSLWERLDKASTRRREEKEKSKGIEQKQRELEMNKAKGVVWLTSLCLKYKLDTEFVFDLYSLKEKLREKDKYLDLGLAMLQTRNDWSEGFYRVKSALDRFEVVSSKDKEIANDIYDLVYGEESDGRIFRDATWGYDTLISMADDDLAKDCIDLTDYMEYGSLPDEEEK